LAGRGFPSGQRGGTQDPLAQAFEGSNPSPRTFRQTPENLIGFDEYLKNKGLRESTIETKVKILNMLSKRINLWDSDEVRKLLNDSILSGKRKNNISYAYQDWCRLKGFDYEIKYFEEGEQSLPYIPREVELDQLIAGSSKPYACFMQLLKETGFRFGEAKSLTPNDFDLEKKIVTLNKPAKRSNPRQFRISDKLVLMLTPLIQKTSPNQTIWKLTDQAMSRTFCYRRKVISEKLGNPKLRKISFKTFRHWKATTEYHRTKDILFVKELLGHKSIKNTLIYTHLVDFSEEDSFICKVASNIDEFTALLESGFEFVSRARANGRNLFEPSLPHLVILEELPSPLRSLEVSIFQRL